MKRYFLLQSLTTIVMLTISMTACNDTCNDNGTEGLASPVSSTIPVSRIVGKWKLTSRNGRDFSSDSIYYTFTSEGKMTHTDTEWMNGEEGTFEFSDNWTYYEGTDGIVTRICVNYTETSWNFNCTIDKTKMIWSIPEGCVPTSLFFEKQQ